MFSVNFVLFRLKRVVEGSSSLGHNGFLQNFSYFIIQLKERNGSGNFLIWQKQPKNLKKRSNKDKERGRGESGNSWEKVNDPTG